MSKYNHLSFYFTLLLRVHNTHATTLSIGTTQPLNLGKGYDMNTTHSLDIWHTLEKQGDKVLHTIRTRNKAQATAAMVAVELLEALKWCEQVYGKDWPENASIRETIRKAEGK